MNWTHKEVGLVKKMCHENKYQQRVSGKNPEIAVWQLSRNFSFEYLTFPAILVISFAFVVYL